MKLRQILERNYSRTDALFHHINANIWRRVMQYLALRQRMSHADKPIKPYKQKKHHH